MTPEAVQEVWRFLDRDALARIARRGPTPLFATISGAHLYGFASPDSDVDLRGAFVLPPHDLLGLFPAAETLSLDAEEPMQEGGAPLELDWVAHDVRKFCRMLTAHNGYALEQLFSPRHRRTAPRRAPGARQRLCHPPDRASLLRLRARAAQAPA